MDAEPFKSVEVNEEEERAKEMVVVEKVEEKKEEEEMEEMEEMEKGDNDRPLTILIPRSSPVFQEPGVNLHDI